MEHRFAAFKLPPGRHSLSREHVAESQRWRLLDAAVELLAEGGYCRLTSQKVARRAAVSSQAFYVHFRNIEDCVVAAVEIGAKSMELGIRQGCTENAADPSGQIAGATAEALALLAREPFLRHLFSIETRCAAPRTGRPLAGFVAALATRLQQLLELPDGQASIRCHLLVQAAVVTVSDAPASELSPPSQLADQLTALIGVGAECD